MEKELRLRPRALDVLAAFLRDLLFRRHVAGEHVSPFLMAVFMHVKNHARRQKIEYTSRAATAKPAHLAVHFDSGFGTARERFAVLGADKDTRC